jgi:hypothetical protein
MKLVGACFLRTRKYIYFGITGLMILSLVIGILGLDYWDDWELASIPNQPTEKPPGKISLVINIVERTLEVYSDGEIYKKYRVAVGKSETPTPIGEWNVIGKDYEWGSGFGSRWMGLNVPWATLILEYKIIGCRFYLQRHRRQNVPVLNSVLVKSGGSSS